MLQHLRVWVESDLKDSKDSHQDGGAHEEHWRAALNSGCVEIVGMLRWRKG